MADPKEYTQDERDNHADQLNPNSDAYWRSRGEDERPDNWEELIEDGEEQVIRMKNLLRLHEAIALALLSKKSRIATFDEIASFTEKRGLFLERKRGISLSKQVMLRTTKSKQRYSHLFKPVNKDAVQLRNL